MAKLNEYAGATLHGRGKAFMRLGGRVRYQQMEGRHFVVGGGKAIEYATAPECYEHVETLAREARDRRLASKAQQAAANRAAPEPTTPALDRHGKAFGVGDEVEFEKAPGIKSCGRVGEIGPRSIGIDCEGGERYRRAAGDVSRVA